jgi:hypothetical protein
MDRFQLIKNIGLRAVRLYDEHNHHANIDRVGEALNVMTDFHQRIHQGKAFNLGKIFSGVANGGNADILIQVPVDVSLHLSFGVQAGGDAELRVYENPAVSSVGSAETAINKNRMASTVSKATFTSTPTITGVGTLLMEIMAPGGRGGNSNGGEAGIFDEFVLNDNEDYLCRITNISGIAQDLSVFLNWYEPNGGSTIPL